ncbi:MULTISPECIES: hypothetical protein [Paraburkholderia]|uniref:Uncharacterized protein n=2 Tax=Paraburkholderia TaxID=1822464 RepID=A0A1I3J255_9BURK|nr:MULTISPECIES: hypothetical protein [Paraburkholderia]MCX4160884.1 hypothetical protein [Paraburkholderia megapolitana]MDN7156380.1 hypothetical protein [Paraburkholderia sp. CHISQ3]MDQ6493425.1 hypothetical protein [Paraburkholderia megapolitana]PCE27929.1 hypothetical protein BWP39_05335 [Paraburkholderia acidicola]QDQ84964.1 hypothetical protein FNZ07_28420 [Paraburkholderia megapolitana]
MPHRYQLLEKIAFSLVVLSAVMCSTFIAYESSPEFRGDLKAGKDLIAKSGQYSYGCTTVPSDPCAQLSLQ